MSQTRSLVLMDADRIKNYIFATNRLREIRGASLLLDTLNRPICRRLLKEHGGREVFIGGGGVLATFDSETRAQHFCHDVTRTYRQETHVATITGVVEPVGDESDEPAALQRARMALRLAKGSRNVERALGSSSFFRICSSCNQHPVCATHGGDPLCRACLLKRHADQLRLDVADGTATEQDFLPSYTAYARFAARAENERQDERWRPLRYPRIKLEELEGSETSHIGMIHADVNGLGLYLEGQGSLETISQIGGRVETALERALVDAVLDVGLKPMGDTWPFLIIMMGGDDLLLIVPARTAVQLASRIALRFEEHIARLIPTEGGGAPVALSAGVVIAKPSHPAYVLADVAEQLVKSAKKLSHKLSRSQPSAGPVPTIDFHILYSATANSLDILRGREYLSTQSGIDYHYTMRPFALRTMHGQPGIDRLISTVQQLRGSDFPRNKLNQWADLIYQSELEQILGFETLQTRLTGAAHALLRQITGEFNLKQRSIFAEYWGKQNEFATPLLDLLELYEFITLKTPAPETNESHA